MALSVKQCYKDRMSELFEPLSQAPVPVLPSLQKRKRQFVRDAILNAAVDLFSEKGFDETTVEEIAARAGASRRSFFRYFESKSDLMAQPVIEWGTALVCAVSHAPPNMSDNELLREIVTTVAPASAANPRTRKLIEIAAKYPAAEEAQHSCIVSVRQQLIEALAKRGGSRMQAHLLAGVVFAVLGTAHYVLFEETNDDMFATVQRTLDSLVDITVPKTAVIPSRPKKTEQARG
jgi:AcrR family transcriptional regulator